LGFVSLFNTAMIGQRWDSESNWVLCPFSAE